MTVGDLQHQQGGQPEACRHEPAGSVGAPRGLERLLELLCRGGRDRRRGHGARRALRTVIAYRLQQRGVEAKLRPRLQGLGRLFEFRRGRGRGLWHGLWGRGRRGLARRSRDRVRGGALRLGLVRRVRLFRIRVQPDGVLGQFLQRGQRVEHGGAAAATHLSLRDAQVRGRDGQRQFAFRAERDHGPDRFLGIAPGDRAPPDYCGPAGSRARPLRQTQPSRLAQALRSIHGA